MDESLDVKAGDRLFVRGSSPYDKGFIEVVERLTPTGRIITKHHQYDPNGRRRGETGWGRHTARKATEDDIAGIYRVGLVSKIDRFRQWSKLSADDLQAVAAIVAKHEQ